MIKQTIAGAWLWTTEEDATIRQRLAAGDAFDAIAKDLRRTEGATKARAKKLGLILQQAAKEWSPNEDKRLREILRAGRGTRAAALALNRTEAGIRRRARKLNIPLGNNR